MTRGINEKGSTATIEKYLKGVSFPSRKRDLVERAKNNGASDDTLSILSRLPEQEYHSPIDITKAVSRVERS